MISRVGLAIALLALAVLALAPPALAADAELVKVGDFAAPVYAAAPPGDPSRLVVVERGGKLILLKNDGTRRTFLDISGETSVAGESGLLSMAFAPDYATSGRFYLYDAHDASDQLRILEFRRSAADPDAADPSTRRVALAIDGHTAGNHWGGTLAFGPDGLLYLAPGDNAAGSTTAQNPGPFGKLLRFDPSAAVATTTTVALGLRNPFRFSFDRATGDLALADVGQSTAEEVDFVPSAQLNPGINFGWATCEGLVCGAPGAPAGYVAPVLDYPHSGGACSITGGVVVRDPSLTALNGRYVYADLCVGVIRSAVLAQPSATGDAVVQLAGTTTTLNQPVGFGEDGSGCVYVAALTGNALYRLAPPGGPASCLREAPPGPGPVPGPTPGPGPKVTVVGLSTGGQRKQKILRQKVIRIGVRCKTACTIGARTSVLVGKKRYKLSSVTLQATATDRTYVLVVPLSSKARTAIATALRRRRTALASVELNARGLDGSLDTESRRVRLVR